MAVGYDSIASAYARHRDTRDFVVDALKRLCVQLQGRRLLEIGCGTGAYITAIAQTTRCTGFGLDPSPRMLQRAPAHEGIAYLQGRAARIPFADGSLDMIFSVNVVHHLEDVGEYFHESNRVLRSGGILCTATDSPAIIERRKPLSRYWPSTVALELARYHDIADLRHRMETAGFGDIGECEGRAEFSVSDIGPYRDKAFSCLRLLPEKAFTRGLRALATDLRAGPVEGNSELAFLWGRRL